MLANDFISAQDSLQDAKKWLSSIGDDTDPLLKIIHSQLATFSTISSHETGLIRLRGALRIDCFQSGLALQEKAKLSLEQARDAHISELLQTEEAKILMKSVDMVLACRELILSSDWEVGQFLSCRSDFY